MDRLQPAAETGAPRFGVRSDLAEFLLYIFGRRPLGTLFEYMLMSVA